MADYSKTRSEYLKIMFGTYGQEAIDQINSLNTPNITTSEMSTMQQVNSEGTDRNWWQRTIDTITDTINDIARGTYNFIDTVWDFGVNQVSSLGWIDESKRKELTGYDWQSGATELFNRSANWLGNTLTGDIFTAEHWDFYKDPFGQGAKYQQLNDKGSWLNENKDIKNFVDDLSSGIGYMIPSVTLGVATGGGAMPLMVTGAGMGGFNEAYDETGDYWKSLGYGTATGAVEYVGEKFLGKFLGDIGLGTNKIMGLFGKNATKQTSTSFVKELAKTFFEEGAEEAFSAIVEPIAQMIYKGPDALKGSDGGNIYLDKEFWGDVGKQALVGGTIGGIFGSVSISEQRKALGKDGVKIANELTEISEIQNKLIKLDKANPKYEVLSNELATKIYELGQTFNNGKFNEKQLENVSKLFNNPQALIEEMRRDDPNYKSYIDSQINEMQDIDKFNTRTLFNTLQEQANSDIKLVFDNSIEDNGFYDPSTRTITLKTANAGILAHEYLGHALGDRLSDSQRQSMFEKVIKTDWFKNNNAKLRKAYIDNTLDSETRKRLWQSEVVNKYLENVVREKDLSDIKIKRTIKDKITEVLKLNKNSLLKNNEVAREFFSSIQELLEVTNKELFKATNKYLKGRPLNEHEKSLFESNKELFLELKKASKLGMENESKTDYNEKYERTNEFRRIQERSNALSNEDVQSFHNSSREIDDSTRELLETAFKRQINSTRNSLWHGNRSLVNTKTGNTINIIENVDGKLFHDIFDIVQKYLPNGDAVEVHKVSDYENTTNYLADDGMSGFAITKEGDLISVFSLGERGFLYSIKDYISEKGAKTLDCFNSERQPLATIYAKTLGFKTASLMDFNYDVISSEHGKEYADYFVKTYGEAPVAFMVNTSEDVKTKHFNKDQYDEAQQYQLSFVKEFENLEDVKVKFVSINKINTNDFKSLRSVLEKKNIFSKYQNVGNTNLSGVFSKNSLRECWSKCLTAKSDKNVLSSLLNDLPKILDNAIKIESHNDYKNENNIKRVNELISFFEYDGDIHLAKITLKEMNNPDENSIYLVLNKDKIKRDHFAGYVTNVAPQNDLSSTYNLVELLQLVKSDELRYIPNKYLSEEQIKLKDKYLREEDVRRANKKKGAGSPVLRAITNNSNALPASTSETRSGTSSPLSTKKTDKKEVNVKDVQLGSSESNQKRDHNFNYDISEINTNLNLSKVKVGGNGKIIRDSNTEPLFKLAEKVQNISEKSFGYIERQLFTDIAQKFNISLDINAENPSIKSIDSFADRLYRNIVEKNNASPKIVKDLVRGTYILNADNISSVKYILNDLKSNIINIDIKNNDGYKGIHLNLNVEGIPVEIQLHTEKSRKLKTQSDAFYEKYRSVDKSKFTKEEFQTYVAQKNKYYNLWNQMLEERDFKALRASASELKNSTLSSLGSVSQPYKGFEITDHSPLENSNIGKLDSSINRPVADKTNLLTDSSSFSNKSIAQTSKQIHSKENHLKPFETNEAQAIKESANAKQGKVIKLSSVAKSYNELLDMLDVEIKIDKKSEKVRALFERYNLMPKNTQYRNATKFVDDVFNGEVENGNTLNDYYNLLGYDVEKYKKQLSKALVNILNNNAYDSNTTKYINYLVNSLSEAKKLYRANLKYVREVKSLKENLRKDIEDKVLGLQEATGIPKLFKTFLNKIDFAIQGYASNTNLKNFINVYNDSAFQAVLEKYANETTLDISALKELADNLISSYSESSKIMSADQIDTLISFMKGFKKAYAEVKQGEITKVRNEANDLNLIAKKVALRRNTGAFRNAFNTLKLDAVSIRSLISFMFDGDSRAMKLIYNDLILNPYDKQVQKYVDFVKAKNDITKHIEKRRYKSVRIGKLKVPRYVLYQFYLNTLSTDNLSKMLDNKLTYNNNGTIVELDFDTLEDLISAELTEVEIKELNDLFALYNGDVKDYVEAISERNFGFSVSRENYYPIIASEIYKTQDLTNLNSSRFKINAMSNNNLKSLTNAKTKIELNVDPMALFDRYIESMTITGEIGKASRKFQRLFNLKVNEGESLSSTISKYMPNSQKDYVGFVFNRLIRNIETTERSGFFDRMVGNFSVATLGLNIRPMLKQFASVFAPLSEVGFSSWFKGLNPMLGLNKKARDYLKNNSGIFALRIYDKGYMKSQTLAPDDVNRVIKKIGEVSMFALEKVDRYVCYLTYGMAQQQAKLLGYGEIGTDENLKASIPIFNELLLNTQSNNDRIAMSKIRGGEKGVIKKYLFGMFQADAQVKLSLIQEHASKANSLKYESKHLEENVKQILNSELDEKLKKERARIDDLISRTDSEERRAELKKRYQDFELEERKKTNDHIAKEIEYRKANNPLEIKENKKAIAKWSVATLGSAVVVFLADLLADYIYDKDKDDEEYLLNLLQNTFIDWVPYVNTLVNAINYEGTSFLPLEGINEFASTINKFMDGNISRSDITGLIMSLGQLIGLPINNLYKLVNGIIAKFDPKTALKYNSLLYGTSAQYLNKKTLKYIEKGQLDKATDVLTYNYSLYKFKISEPVAKEIVKLRSKGINVSIHNALEDKALQLRYNKLNDALLAFIKTSEYKRLDNENKARLIQKLSNIYYDYANGKETKFTKLIDVDFDLSKFIFVGYENKKDLVKELNKTRLTYAEKLLSAYLSGYNLPSENMKIVDSYLRKNSIVYL